MEPIKLVLIIGSSRIHGVDFGVNKAISSCKEVQICVASPRKPFIPKIETDGSCSSCQSSLLNNNPLISVL